MKYLSKYKLFEAKKSLVDGYLDKMGATRNDIQEIFLDMTDQGYNLKFKVSYKDASGRVRNNKTTSKETPILKISLSSNRTHYVGGSTKFDNLTYIESLYHTLSRFMTTYEGKVKKMSYELDSKAELSILCFFEDELDDSKLEITKEQLNMVMDHVLSVHLPTYYQTQKNDGYGDTQYHIKMIDSARKDKAKEMIDELTKSDDDYLTNHEENTKLIENIRNEFTDILTKSFGKDIRYINRGSESGIFVFENSVVKYKLADLSIYDMDSTRYNARVKTGFLSRKNVEVEVYYSIVIRLKLI